MPLDADRKGMFGKFQCFDRFVRSMRACGESLPYGFNDLMVKAVYIEAGTDIAL